MDTPENICKFVMNHGTEEDITMMNKMLQDRRISSPDVRCSEWYNGTALMYQSSFNGTFEALEFLIYKGADVDLTNDLRETALFYAVGCTMDTGLRKKTILLLREGAKVWGLKDSQGLTVIEACDNQKMKAQLQEIANEEEMNIQTSEFEKENERMVKAQIKNDMVRDALKGTLKEAEAKTSSDPDEEKYQKIEMTRFKGGKTKKRRRKRRKTKKHRKSKNNRKPRK